MCDLAESARTPSKVYILYFIMHALEYCEIFVRYLHRERGIAELYFQPLGLSTCLRDTRDNLDRWMVSTQVMITGDAAGTAISIAKDRLSGD